MNRLAATALLALGVSVLGGAGWRALSTLGDAWRAWSDDVPRTTPTVTPARLTPGPALSPERLATALPPTAPRAGRSRPPSGPRDPAAPPPADAPPEAPPAGQEPNEALPSADAPTAVGSTPPPASHDVHLRAAEPAAYAALALGTRRHPLVGPRKLATGQVLHLDGITRPLVVVVLDGSAASDEAIGTAEDFLKTHGEAVLLLFLARHAYALADARARLRAHSEDLEDLLITDVSAALMADLVRTVPSAHVLDAHQTPHAVLEAGFSLQDLERAVAPLHSSARP